MPRDSCRQGRRVLRAARGCGGVTREAAARGRAYVGATRRRRPRGARVRRPARGAPPLLRTRGRIASANAALQRMQAERWREDRAEEQPQPRNGGRNPAKTLFA